MKKTMFTRMPMSKPTPKRDPLAQAPTSQEIMSGARRRNHNQQASATASQHTSIPVKREEVRPKATFYLRADLLKALKRFAVEKDETQSRVVETAIEQYIQPHTAG